MSGKSRGNVYPPLALRRKEQCAEKDDVWRPEWRKDPIAQGANGERSLRAKIVSNRHKKRLKERLDRPSQLSTSEVQPPLTASVLFQSESAFVHGQTELWLEVVQFTSSC